MRSVCMTDDASIRIKKELREILKKKRKYRRETYNDIIMREIKSVGKFK